MKAGNLDRRITVQKATSSDDGFSAVTNYGTSFDLFASKKDISDSERIRAGGISAEITTRFVVRWSAQTAAITPKDRIQYRGMNYDIFSVKEVGRMEGVEITAGAVADA